MLTKANRITVVCLSVVTVCLGVACVVLLYYAGQRAIDAFYVHQTYTDEQGRIYRKNPEDELVGRFFMKGWGFGFIYVTAGIFGILVGLFNNAFTVGIDIALSVIFLLAGSFIHTAGILSIVMFRILVDTGSIRYDPTFGDCVFEMVDPASQGVLEKYVDDRCISARMAVLYVLIALALFLVAWVFQFTNILVTAFVYQNRDTYTKKKKNTSGDSTTNTGRAPLSTGTMSTTGTQTWRRRRGPGSESASRRPPSGDGNHSNVSQGQVHHVVSVHDNGNTDDARNLDGSCIVSAENIPSGSADDGNEHVHHSSPNKGNEDTFDQVGMDDKTCIETGYDGNTNEAFEPDDQGVQLQDVVVQPETESNETQITRI